MEKENKKDCNYGAREGLHSLDCPKYTTFEEECLCSKLSCDCPIHAKDGI